MKLIEKSKTAAWAGLVCLALSGCATVTVTPEGEPKLTSEPNYQNSMDFFFWGLSPEVNTVNVEDVCVGSGVRQMQAQTTFGDGVLGVVTLGIYAPRTVKVWCDQEEA